MIQNAFVLTGANLLLRLLGTAFQVWLSRQMGAAGIGLLQLTMSVGSLAMIAGMAGVRTATMYLSAEELGRKQPQNTVWVLSGCTRYSFLASLTVAAALLLLAPRIAEHWIGESLVTPCLRLFALFLPVCCLSGVMSGYFTAANRIRALAAVEVAEQLTSMTVTVCALVLWAKGSSIRCCQAVILGSGMGACMTLVTLVLLRLRERYKIPAPIPVKKRLLSVALPLAGADILKSGINTTENLMVPKRLALHPGMAAPLASFGLLGGMVFPVLMFPSCILFSLAELLIPELARCRAGEDPVRIRYLAQKSLSISFLYGFFLAGAMFLEAGPLCDLLYQNSEAGAWLRRYALLIPMLYSDAVIDAMTKGLGQQTKCVRNNIFTSALDVIFLYLLLPWKGMEGYYLSFLITHLTNFLLSLRLLRQSAGGSLFSGSIGLYGLCAFFAALVAGLLRAPLPRLLGYTALFFSASTVTGAITPEDRKWFRNLFHSRKATFSR